MSATASAGRRAWSDPTRIGQARPSHLVTTGGVGALVDLPSMSAVVRGLDAWSPERQEVIDEPRLLDEVRGVLGQQVRTLRTAPWDPDADDDPWTHVGVPVTPFPRWMRCPACFRLGPLDPPGQFTLVHQWGRRPDLAKYVHAHCTKQAQKRDRNKKRCLPARFLVACEEGHLDDFPYVEFVHRGADGVVCSGPKLTLQDSSSTLGPRVNIKCSECGASRNVSRAAGREGRARLPLCRGRHPHLQTFEGCGQPLRLVVLGASNLWFSVTTSALHLPLTRGVGEEVATHWEVLGEQPSAQVVAALVEGMPALRALREVPTEAVWSAIEELRAAGGPSTDRGGRDLLEAEWELLSHPTTDRQDADFRAVPTEVPDGHEGLLQQVVLVSRLREVQALVGFTRLSAPERRDSSPEHRVALARGDTTWVPAVERRGEGIFLELHEEAVAAWVAGVTEHPRIEALRQAHRRWARNRDKPPDPGFPIARYVLLHTLSHLLVRQVSLECGYSSASLAERLYVGTPSSPAAGVLISTAASDSEGTLGGLVALGRTVHLGRLLDDALRDAERCSSDPLCAEHVPEEPSDALHAAACHACLFASETTCENNNRWLDRALLVPVPGCEELAFVR